MPPRDTVPAMNFALLGDDPAALPLARAIAAHPDHALTRASLAGDTLPELLRLSPATKVGDRWDELLVARDVDAVIVAGARQEILDAAKQIAAAGRPLVIIADARQGSQWIYELTLIRDDTRAPLLPVFPHREAGAVRRLRDACESYRIGHVRHVQMERDWPAALLSPADVERALLPDVALLRDFAGDYSQVTAIHSGASEGRLSLATVTLSGPGLPESHWSLRPTADAGGARWHVVGDGGRATLLVPDGGLATLEVNGIRESCGRADVDADGVSRIERALRGESVSPGWTDLTRAFEVVDAARRSVRRRRTIDLHFETQSERSLFKSQMTAVGCGLLVFTLLAVVAVLILGTVFDVDRRVMRAARVAVFAPLFLYLALQALLFLARPPLTSREKGGSP